MTNWASDVEWWDELVVCPTCKHVARPDDDAEDAHEQPCPRCGFTQLAIVTEERGDGSFEVRARWNPGEGAQLFLHDVSLAARLADEFIAKEDAEEERIDTAITQMRLQRQQEEN